jgi:hypothetical protein
MTEHLHGKGVTGQENTDIPAANATSRKKGVTPGSQRGGRENEESRPQKMVWGGGNDHDRGKTGIGGVEKAVAFTVGEPRMASRVPVR